MRARCKSNACPDGRVAALTVGQSYAVIGIEAGDLRVIDDMGAPVLFEPELFEITEAARPAGWVSETIEGDEYAGPAEFSGVGFWEDYFEQDPDARAAFSRYLNQHLGTTDAA